MADEVLLGADGRDQGGGVDVVDGAGLGKLRRLPASTPPTPAQYKPVICNNALTLAE